MSVVHRPGTESFTRTAPGSKKQLERHPVSWSEVAGVFSGHKGLIGALVGLTIVAAVLGLGTPLLIREIINVALPTGDLRLLTALAAAMVVIAALLQLTNLGQTVLSAKLGERAIGDLRVSVFTHIQRLDLSYFMREGESSIRARLSSDISAMRNVVTTTGVAIVTNVAVCVATVAAMLAISWQLALASFIAIPLAIWVARSTGRRRQELQFATQELNEALDGQIAEALSADGMLLNRATGTVAEVERRFVHTTRQLTAAESKLQMVGGGRLALIGFAFAVLPAGIYWFGGYLNVIGDESLGTLVAFASLQFAVMRPAMGVLNISTQIVSSKALFSRVFELLALPTEMDRKNSLLPGASRAPLTFSDVSYSYDARREVLNGISFTVEPGDFLSIVGPSGVGKSTLAKLGAGLLTPAAGSVAVAGNELSHLSYDALAGYVRLVPQDTFIQAASLRANLTWGASDASAAEIRHALAVAQLNDFVSTLPDGIDTDLGARGATLSGGQRQRVAIARAVLAQPHLLILDESTSALDGETERELLLALREEFTTRMIVLITHRPQAAAHASRTIEVRDGRLRAVDMK